MGPPEAQHAIDAEPAYAPPQAKLTPASQSKARPSSSPSRQSSSHQQLDRLHRSGTLTFPTLESDGSLPDLREAPAPIRRYHTPPAALSSLGARASMSDNVDMASSVGSLEDSTYDVIEDFSEISTNDGRETASLASSDRAVSDDEGELTPEEEGDAEEFIAFNTGSVGNLARTLGVKSDEQSMEEANRVMDSYMSEDLDTPRQSTIRIPASLRRLADPAAFAAARQAKASPTLRVLLCGPPISDMSLLAHRAGRRIATCLSGGADQDCKITELPTTPDNSKGTLLCRHENLEVTIDCMQYPTAAPIIAPISVKSSKHGGPDLLVLYVSNTQGYPHSFVDALPSSVPVIKIMNAAEDDARARRDGLRGMTIDPISFFDGDDFELRLDLLAMLDDKLPQGRALFNPVPSSAKHSEATSWLGHMTMSSALIRLAVGALVLALLMPSLFETFAIWNDRPVASIEDRRNSLSTSLKSWANKADGDFSEILPHLLPGDRASTLRGVFAVFPPDQIVVSVADGVSPPPSGPSGPSGLASTIVSRHADRDLLFSISTLIDGIYGITIPVEEAHGIINVNLTLKKPPTNVLVTHDFGSRAWHRSTYQKAGTDLTKAINKDVAVAREAAKSLTGKVGLELTAGVAATQNVTSQLAVRMTRDVQVFASTALGFFGKAASQSAGKAQKISKELAVARKDLIERVDDVKKSLATTAHSIKDLIVLSRKNLASPLSIARQRALDIEGAAKGKKQDVQAKSLKAP